MSLVPPQVDFRVRIPLNVAILLRAFYPNCLNTPRSILSANFPGTWYEMEDALCWLRRYDLVEFQLMGEYATTRAGFEVADITRRIERENKEELKTIIKALLFLPKSFSFNWSRTKSDTF